MPLEIEVPQWVVECMQIEDQYVLLLSFSSSGQQTKVYLCEASQNYQDLAKRIHDGICKAGAEARRIKSGLITVKDLPDGLKGINFNGSQRNSHSKERQQRRSGGSGS